MIPRVLLAACAAAAVLPASASAKTLITFKTEIDVDLSLTEKSHWQGIRDGCFAPAENFDATYDIDVDTTSRGKDSTLRAGTATLTDTVFGATSTYGDAGSFRQRMTSAPWELQTAYPAGADCGPDPAPAPPEWATSPSCKPVSERVAASLVAVPGPSGNGSIVITRTPKKATLAAGGSMGASCLRTLHPIAPEGEESEVGVLLRSTFIQVPVPGLETKLLKLAQGKKGSRPSFTVKVDVGGDCNEMRMKPRLGRRGDFTRSPFTQPNEALGPFTGEDGRSACLIAGSGRVIVRRAGAVAKTKLP